jgi:tetratricopeptide (TPR) repeat protein
MKTLRVAALIASLGFCAALAGAEDAEEAAPPSLEAVRRQASSPLTDPGQGRLYGSVARMLNAVRALPPAIDLRLPKRPAGGQAPPTEPQQEPETEQKPQVKPPVEEQKGWIAVFGAPIADGGRLARALYMAGSYREAADLYSDLLEEEPEDEHLLVMLALSERNAGDRERAEELLAELAERETPAGQWAEWTLQMMSLSQPEDQESE